MRTLTISHPCKLHAFTRPAASVARFAARRCTEHETSTSQSSSPAPQIATFLTAAAASYLLTIPSPAIAQLETVSAGTAMASAQPLQAKPYDKGKVWLVLIGGAASLFLITVAAENNTPFFPAIAKANQAIKEYIPQEPVATNTNTAPERKMSFEEAEMQARSEEAVLDGLRAASQKVNEKGRDLDEVIALEQAKAVDAMALANKSANTDNAGKSSKAEPSKVEASREK